MWAGRPAPVSPTPDTSATSASTVSGQTDPFAGRAAVTQWTRRPTGVPGGLPTGPKTQISSNEKPRERRALELEDDCAVRVADKGYRIHQNPTKQEVAEARQRTGDSGRPEKTPDYLIEGYVFDCYAPTPPVPARAVWSAISKKIAAEQTQRVILNLLRLAGRSCRPAEAVRRLAHFWAQGTHGVDARRCGHSDRPARLRRAQDGYRVSPDPRW